MSVQATQSIDRELSSELEESPIDTLLHMCVPGKDSSGFHLQVSGKALWRWRNETCPGKLFDIVQDGLIKIGYRLSESSRARIGKNVKARLDYINHKIRGTTDSNARKAMQAKYWCSIALDQKDVAQGPADVIGQMQKEKKELILENQRSRNALEAQASQLYDAMAQLRSAQRRDVHNGKDTANVGQRQQQRHLRDIRDKAQRALFFAETYGLVPKSLSMADRSGREINVSLGQTPGQNNCQPYASLDEEDTEKIKAILFIMDRFSISLEAYHELTQVQKSLPRTHHIEGFAKSLDKMWDVRRTPGKAEGAELPLKLLLECEIRQCLKNNTGNLGPIKVKIAGDGTRMSHSTSLFVCTFSLVEDGQNCLSSSGTHTIAIVKEKEEHESLKASLANVIHDVNSLASDGHILVDGQKVQLEIYLGGDYKFLLIAMGMKAATSNNSCIWCKVHKNERCNMSHNCEFFQSSDMARTLGPTWSRQPGCFSQPFFAISPRNVVLDELHLMLRITDRLLEGVIFDILRWDEDDNHNKPFRQRNQVHLQDFLSAVRSLGVSLNVHRIGDKWEWTSLLGREKRTLLRKLPELFSKFLPEARVDATRNLWNNFQELLDILNMENLTAQQITSFEAKALDWGKRMCSMAASGPGYMQTIIITPYMHSLIYHVPVMLQRHGSLRKFSGQGVEKKNDDLRRYFHRKINRWDAATNLLLVEKRQEQLRGMERTKRPYEKRNTAFWYNGNKQEAAKKVPRISTQKPTPVPQQQPPPPAAQQQQPLITEAFLRQMKVPELLALLEEKTGQRLNKRTRKQDVITALMLSSTSE